MSMRSEIMEDLTEERYAHGARQWCTCCGWTFTGCEWTPKEHDFLCVICQAVTGRGLYKEDKHYYCNRCLTNIRNENLSQKPSPIACRTVDSDEHERMMREAQDG